MALTTELLNANAALSGLTDDQKNAIVEMSANDENTVIAKKTGEIYGGLDADILTASGIAKNGAERTFDYAKRVIGEIKGQAGNAAQLQTQISDLTKEKARLEKVIAEGGADVETKKALAQGKADLANVTKEFTDLKTKYDNAEAEHTKALFMTKLDSEFAKATAGIKFKADIPATVHSVLLSQALEKLKGMNPSFEDDGNGGKMLVFKNADGSIMKDAANNLRPFTASELVARELKTLGVLDEGRQQTGAGSQGGQGGTGGGNGIFDISGARTQDEVTEMITKQLLSQGLINGSKAFEDAKNKIWKDNIDVIKKLPIR